MLLALMIRKKIGESWDYHWDYLDPVKTLFHNGNSEGEKTGFLHENYIEQILLTIYPRLFSNLNEHIQISGKNVLLVVLSH